MSIRSYYETPDPPHDAYFFHLIGHFCMVIGRLSEIYYTPYTHEGLHWEAAQVLCGAAPSSIYSAQQRILLGGHQYKQQLHIRSDDSFACVTVRGCVSAQRCHIYKCSDAACNDCSRFGQPPHVWLQRSVMSGRWRAWAAPR